MKNGEDKNGAEKQPQAKKARAIAAPPQNIYKKISCGHDDGPASGETSPMGEPEAQALRLVPLASIHGQHPLARELGSRQTKPVLASPGKIRPVLGSEGVSRRHDKLLRN